MAKGGAKRASGCDVASSADIAATCADGKKTATEPSGAPGERRVFYLYVVECADGTFYTGYTVDVEERVRAHNEGSGVKYTRSRRPVRLLAQAAFVTQHEALSAEYRFKRLTRRQKERLLARAATEPFEVVLAEVLLGGSS